MQEDLPAEERRHNVRSLVPFSKGDYIVVGLLLAIPIITYALAVPFGHLVVPGDDLNQNLPLRILSGQFIAAGRLPAWNPLIWSGTPLLAGWNAGALFPGTLLFAFLPISLAWTINLVAAPFICSLGLYLLLRRFAVSELGAFFGALIFSYTGFMSGQMVHLGLVQGTACMPWLLLGIDIFLRRDPTRNDIGQRGLRQRLRELKSMRTQLWIVVIAIALAGTVLAGDPRAITSTAIVAIIYILALIIRDRKMLGTALLPLSLAAVFGFMLSAIQLLPGIAFLNSSQRGTATINFFASGSLPIREIIINSLVPFALGTNGNLGLRIYAGDFNLPEVTIGAGLIAVIALCSYLPELVLSYTRWLKQHRVGVETDPQRQLSVWFTLLVVGVVLTMGTDTPFGRVLYHLPLYGTERLQNRNAVMIDIALAMFAAFFFDKIVERAHGQERLSGASKRVTRMLGAPLASVLGMLPVLGTLALIVIEIVSPLTIERWLKVPYPTTALRSGILGYLIASAVLATAIGVFWWQRDRFSPRTVRAMLSVLLIFDIGMYIANAGYATAPTSAFTGSTTLSSEITHDLGGQGRFAIFDPLYYLTFADPALLSRLGFPDINAVHDNPSAQGYGSIVNGVYEKVTGTHLIDAFNASILPGESVNTLDLRILLVPPGYLDSTVASHAAVPIPSGQALSSNGSSTAVSGPWTIATGANVQWQLPAPIKLARASVLFKTLTKSPVRITLYNKRTRVFTNVENVNGSQKIDPFPTNLTVTTIAVSNLGTQPLSINAVTAVSTQPQHRYVLNGLLQGQLNNAHWVYDGIIGGLTVYKNIRIHGFAWLQPPTSHTPNTALSMPGSVKVKRGAVTEPSVMDVTTAHTAILVRSEAYSSGWSATITSLDDGASTTERVHRFGLIQAITIPAGSYRITWHYRPLTLTAGLLLTLVGTIITIGIIAELAVRRRLMGSVRRRLMGSA